MGKHLIIWRSEGINKYRTFANLMDIQRRHIFFFRKFFGDGEIFYEILHLANRTLITFIFTSNHWYSNAEGFFRCILIVASICIYRRSAHQNPQLRTRIKNLIFLLLLLVVIERRLVEHQTKTAAPNKTANKQASKKKSKTNEQKQRKNCTDRMSWKHRNECNERERALAMPHVLVIFL